MFLRIVAGVSIAIYLINPLKRADETFRKAGFDRMCVESDGCQHLYKSCYSYRDHLERIIWMADELEKSKNPL